MADMRDGSAGTPAETNGAPPAAAAAAAPPKAEIGGFWRRLAALLIDGFLLAIVGMIIGAFAFRQLVDMGQSGRLIGAAIALVYYGFLNSGWGGGATLGKRIMGLRVVRRDGQTIGLFRSLLRTIVFWTPFYLNGVFFQSVRIPGLPDDDRIAVALGIADLLIVFVGMFLIVYLYIFNARTRQTLHDLIAGTFVVRAPSVGAPIAAHFWKGHLAIAAGVFALAIAAPIGFLSSLQGGKPIFAGAFSLPNTSNLQDAVLARPGVRTAQIQTSTTVFSNFNSAGSSTVTVTTLNVVVNARGIPQSTAAMENDIAETVLKTDPTLLGQRTLSVKVQYGYDLGIWSWSGGDQFTGTPAEWEKRLRDAKQTTSA